MSNRIQCADLHIDEALHSLLVNEIAPGTGIDPDHFWQGVADIWAALGPENQRLLGERDSLQTQIDQWHRDHQGEAFDADAYEAFLREIGYLHPEPASFSITTDNVDPEIAQIAGPQLVVICYTLAIKKTQKFALYLLRVEMMKAIEDDFIHHTKN